MCSQYSGNLTTTFTRRLEASGDFWFTIRQLCFCAPRKRGRESALQMQRNDRSGLLQQPDDLSSKAHPHSMLLWPLCLSPTPSFTSTPHTRPPAAGCFKITQRRPLEANIYNAVLEPLWVPMGKKSFVLSQFLLLCSTFSGRGVSVQNSTCCDITLKMTSKRLTAFISDWKDWSRHKTCIWRHLLVRIQIAGLKYRQNTSLSAKKVLFFF